MRFPIMILALSLAARLQAQVPLRLLISNGMKGSVEALHAQAERAAGPLNITFSSTAGIRQRIEKGEAFDATVITVEAIDALAKQGKLDGATRVNLGRSVLGIGIRTGAAKPDIKSIDGFKKALAAAPSITYPKDGASRAYVEAMFEKLGIAAAVKPKIILADGSGPATESVAAGKAALVITLFSEIIPVKGVEILGPLPGEHHYDIRFAAATAAGTQNSDAARKFLAFLSAPAQAAMLKSKGIEK